MATLQNFPHYDQRITTLRDGSIDPNRWFNCVPTSIAMALAYFTGRPFEGGILKEDVYGRAYQGGTAAVSYVQYVSHYGVRLSPVQGDNQQLVQATHAAIQAGHPVILSEIDPYCSDAERADGWSHVVIAFSEDVGTITVADPFIGQSVTKSDGQWVNDLMFSEVWMFERINQEVEPVAISISTPKVGDYYKDVGGGLWHCTIPTHDFVIGGAILTFYRTLGNAGLCGLTILGLPCSNEMGIAGKPGRVYQEFERGIVAYDPPPRLIDNPPGAGPVYLTHRDLVQPSPAAPSVALQKDLDTARGLVIDLQHKLQVISQVLKS